MTDKTRIMTTIVVGGGGGKEEVEEEEESGENGKIEDMEKPKSDG